VEIHKPKPWHGWREFLKEVATIVLGVSIAIGAEQLVERLHWAHEVRAARIAIADEMARSNGHLAFRVAAEPCIARRLDSIETVIEKVARRAPAPRLGVLIPDIGNAFNDNVWANYRASQTLTHFDDTAQADFSAYYLQIGSVRLFEQDETNVWAVLKVLQGDPSRLGPVDVAGLRVALQHARFDNHLIAGIAADELETAKRLNVGERGPADERLKDLCGSLPTFSAS
jgi:hypothetical protein